MTAIAFRREQTTVVQMTEDDLVREIRGVFNGGTYEKSTEAVARYLVRAILAEQAPFIASQDLTQQRIDQHIRALQLLREMA